VVIVTKIADMKWRKTENFAHVNVHVLDIITIDDMLEILEEIRSQGWDIIDMSRTGIRTALFWVKKIG
jgi:hypothetical protein